MTETPKPEAFADGFHPCESPDCSELVAYDDEPYCFEHSPDSGANILGYSYKAGDDYHHGIHLN